MCIRDSFNRGNKKSYKSTMSDLYKVLTISEWENANENGFIETSLDIEDGFVHLSSSKQLALTLSLYFESESKLILLQIDDSEFGSSLVHEEIEGQRQGRFAHLYNKLSIDQISKKWIIERNSFDIPAEILQQIEMSN